MKRTGLCHYAKGIGLSAAACLACLALFTVSLAQKPAAPITDSKQTPKEAKPAATKQPYTVKIKKSPLLIISVKAEKAKVSDVAQELSKQLKVPIFLGPERQNELLTIEFNELTLEPALQLMSPTV